MNSHVVTEACGLFGIDEESLKPLSGGHVNQVYACQINNQPFVLRITPPNEEITFSAMQSILDWVHFLAHHQVPVVMPISSRNGQLIEKIHSDEGIYLACVQTRAPGVLAETLSFDDWDDKLFISLGHTTGKLHQATKSYLAPKEITPRHHWNESGNCFWPEPIDPSKTEILKISEEIINKVSRLPKNQKNYGLIHMDFHAGNFYLDKQKKRITIIDFDDCAYGWFLMDIAMHILDLCILFPDTKKEPFVKYFFPLYAAGYRSQSSLDRSDLETLPLFLKLLEVGIYSMLAPWYEKGEFDDYTAKFMPGREEKIRSKRPFLELDFGAIIS